MPSETSPIIPLAIVGIACRLPGASNLDEFWKMLCEGGSGIREFPPDRLDQQLYYVPDREVIGKAYSRIAGIVPSLPVDREPFPLPEELLTANDPTHLTMCQVACAAIHDAGYDPQNFPLKNTGVFLGNFSGSNLESDLAINSHAEEFSQLLRETSRVGGLSESEAEEVSAAMAASIRRRFPAWENSAVQDPTPGNASRLVSRVLGLTAPPLTSDAACASSFIVLHLAAMALQAGRIDAALIGAFSYRKAYEMVLFSPTQTVSPHDSRPFCADSDGMVPSDGYAALLIMPLSLAQKEGRRIHGVIRALGVSSDGRGKGFWAPRPEGQIAAIRRAYEHGMDPGTLQYIEAHATSTQLGDPTEIGSLTEAIGTQITGRIPVSSVKANVGHTLEVAGFAGLLKTLLAMRHGMIPPARGCQPLNPKIPWEQLPFALPQTLTPWPEPPRGCPRRAGINSFGIGGLNTHLVVDARPGISEPETAEQVPPRNLSKAPIAVLGIGVAHPDPVFTRSLLESLGAQVPEEPPGTDYVFNWQKHRLPPKQVSMVNPLQLMLLDAAVLALEDAGLANGNFDRSRAAAVVGSLFTSDYSCDAYIGLRLPELQDQIAQLARDRCWNADQIQRIQAAFEEQLIARKPGSRDVTASISSSTLSSMISKHLDLMGGAYSIDAGEQSAHAALLTAIDLLQSGSCEMVICATGQKRTDSAFLTQQAAGRPITLGSGAAAVVLKRVSAAQRDGNPIQWVLPEDLADRLHATLSRLRASEPSAFPKHDVPSKQSSPGESESPQELLINLLLEQTGYPRVLIGRDSHLEFDLKLDRLALQELWQELHSRLSLRIKSEDYPTDLQTVGDLLEAVAEDQARTELM